MSAVTRSRRRGIITLTETPTVTASPDYADGDNMGGKMTMTPVFGTTQGGGGLIQSIVLADAAKNGLQIDVWLFNADPTGSTLTDNSPIAVAAADYGKVIDRVPVVDWDNDGAIGSAGNLAIPFDIASDSLYVALEARGAHNLAATTDIDIKISIVPEWEAA